MWWKNTLSRRTSIVAHNVLYLLQKQSYLCMLSRSSATEENSIFSIDTDSAFNTTKTDTYILYKEFRSIIANIQNELLFLLSNK